VKANKNQIISTRITTNGFLEKFKPGSMHTTLHGMLGRSAGQPLFEGRAKAMFGNEVLPFESMELASFHVSKPRLPWTCSSSGFPHVGELFWLLAI